MYLDINNTFKELEVKENHVTHEKIVNMIVKEREN